MRLKMFYLYYIYWILGFVMIPGIALGIWAQIKVYTTFNEYNKIETKHGWKAKQVARFVLDSAGYVNTKITQTSGELTDNYNPKTDTVSLSENVVESNSISAVGVACHEVGHVFQHKQGFLPIKFRNVLVPVMNVSVGLSWPLIIVGLVLESIYYTTAADILIWIGIGVYGLNILFCLITLPIEINASKRAEKILLSTGEMDQNEIEGVKKVLSAAAWTYVAALITSILSVLRLLLFVFMLRDRN